MDINEITICVKHLSSRVYEITINPRETVERLKEKVAELSNISVDTIKLIFRGKILKNNSDILTDLGITTGHTIHMVKKKTKASKPEPLNKNPAHPSPNVDQNAPNVNPFSNTGANTDPISSRPYPGMGPSNFSYPDMNNAMQNPQIRETMHQLLANPEMLRNMINSNPMLQGMISNNPQLQAMFDNPDMLRNMAAMMENGRLPGFPGMNIGRFPTQPGTQPTDGTAQGNTQTGTNTQTSQPGTTPPPPNPNMSGFPGFSGQNTVPDLNSMMNDPNFQARMRQFQQMYGQGGQGGGQGGGLNLQNLMGGLNAPIPPQNVNNPEETYKDQLAQLEQMGFINKELNIAVLKQTYGDVQRAIEKLINM